MTTQLFRDFPGDWPLLSEPEGPLKVATHALALLIVCAAAFALKDDFLTENDSSSESATASSQKQGATATAWLDDSLKSIREESARKQAAEVPPESYVPDEAETIAGFLRDNSIRVDEERKAYAEEVDEFFETFGNLISQEHDRLTCAMTDLIVRRHVADLKLVKACHSNQLSCYFSISRLYCVCPAWARCKWGSSPL